jgi:hypothetical protein
MVLMDEDPDVHAGLSGDFETEFAVVLDRAV